MTTPARSVDGRPKSLGRVGDLVIALVVTWVGSLALMDGIRWLLMPMLEVLDPDDAFLRHTIHHILQLTLTLVLMRVFLKAPLRSWGLNLRNWQASLRTVLWFCLIWTAVSAATSLAAVAAGAVPAVGHPLTAQNVVGSLAFQLLLSGTSEEALFRGFAMTLLAVSWKGSFHVRSTTFSASALLATLIFMLGHVDVDLLTLTVTRVDPVQQILAMCLGLFYAVTFERTGSLMAPMVMHGCTNFVSTASLYAMHLLVGP